MANDFLFPKDKQIQPDADCFANPLVTPNWILSKYPKIDIGISEKDPLRDDAYRFAYRLLKLEKKVKIFFCRNMLHDPIMSTNESPDPNQEDVIYNKIVIERFKKWLKKRYSSVKTPENIINKTLTKSKWFGNPLLKKENCDKSISSMEKDTSKSLSIEDVNNNCNNHLDDSMDLSKNNDTGVLPDLDSMLLDKYKTPKSSVIITKSPKKDVL